MEKVTLKSIFENMNSQVEPLRTTIQDALAGKIAKHVEERLIQIIGMANAQLKELGKSLEYRIDKVADKFYSVEFFYNERKKISTFGYVKFSTYSDAHTFAKMVYKIGERADLLNINPDDEGFEQLMATFYLECASK